MTVDEKERSLLQNNKKSDKQLFIKVNDVTSQKVGVPGKWDQTSYNASLVDGGQKYIIRIEGVLTLQRVSFEKVFTIELYCNEYGKIYYG
ncbi:hypothetical protein [Heyndrickxia oleronia]|uniref:Uncharacterized protein n=1 Tax=Heyndrickxia oleronia TaxID=38875 RepID=A0AAW6SYA7_9BACI|nr:hypothetical protein [Heyndrickxia oleronia]MDH5160956.1 hypothetical protein [Heyndrickxia oleronia]